ncbi:MAG: hypothetical protein JSR82_10615 [Verrucomicrobia bacterium]|nr:hypothetical protein [Verrucomicrobiota bacterium]
MVNRLFHLLAVCLALTATTGLRAGLDDLRGTWQLDRPQSETMREVLAAQGYSGFEIAILDRVGVTQIIEPDPAARMVTIRTKTTVVGTTEQLTLDDIERPADSPLGRVERAAAWDESAQTLRTRNRYAARNGQRVQLVTLRRRLDAQRFTQETRLRLPDGRELRAKQIFVRK